MIATNVDLWMRGIEWSAVLLKNGNTGIKIDRLSCLQVGEGMCDVH